LQQPQTDIRLQIQSVIKKFRHFLFDFFCCFEPSSTSTVRLSLYNTLDPPPETSAKANFSINEDGGLFYTTKSIDIFTLQTILTGNSVMNMQITPDEE